MKSKRRQRISRLGLGGKLIIQGLADVAIKGLRRISPESPRVDSSGPQRPHGVVIPFRAAAGRRYFGGGGGRPRPAGATDRASQNARSNAFNPTSQAHRGSTNNRSNQLNPNNAAYRSSRGGGKGR